VARWSVLALSLAACVSDNTLYRQSQVDVFEQVRNDEVDILFVVDDSNSMEEKQAALAEGFIGFMGQLERANSKFHLGVVSTSADPADPSAGALLGSPAVLDVNDDYLARFRERVQVGTAGSDKERGLYAAELALSPGRLAGANAGFLRPEATLLVTFVTDEDDCSDGGVLDGQDSVSCYSDRDLLTPVEQTWDALVAAKEGHPERVRVGAIIGGRGDYACDTAYPGERYAKLAIEHQGLIGDICTGDWSDMLEQLGLEAASVRVEFQLEHAAVEDSLVVMVDGEEVPADLEDGYSYDPVGYVLSFHGDAVPPRGSVVTVEYDLLSGV
jgi:hypothetical protein